MNEPLVKELAYKHRQRFFFALVAVFLLSLPALIFYTTGYRLSFENDETAIVSTGGIYVTASNLDIDVYLDGEQVEQPRLFRSAYYIQNIAAGQHRIVVQRPDLRTWVKELPVDPHIVIEAAAFNMPVVPLVRPITKYVTATGTPVYLNTATTTELFPYASSTVPVLVTPKTRPTEYLPNEEYIFVESLFASSSTSTESVFARIKDEVGHFRFSTTSPLLTDEATTSEPVIERGNIRLVEHDADIYAQWRGSNDTIPNYFCVTNDTASSTALRYGQHVANEVARLALSTTTPLMQVGERVCRPEIKLDRLQKDVYFYDFFSDSADLVLLQLTDGLYVTEIDDRSWQNVQQIYVGTDFQVVVERGLLYVYDDDRYYEIITEIELIQ